MIGLEIPILTRIVRQYESLKDAMAKVLSFDYLGALVASLAFPLILLPTFGTMRTAFFVGLLNLIVASINIWQFKKDLRFPQRLGLTNLVGGILLVVGFIFSFQLTGFFEQFLYQDPILTVPYVFPHSSIDFAFYAYHLAESVSEFFFLHSYQLIFI